MKKLLRFAAVLGLVGALSEEAQAGFGSTAYMTFASDGAGAWAPSLDYRYKGLLIQLPLLNTIGGFTSKFLDIGVAGSGIVAKGSMGGNYDGVLMIGGVFGYYGSTQGNSQGSFHLLMKARLGAEVKKGDRNGMGFGVYVVPLLGVSSYNANATGSNSNFGLAYGGGLEVSAWFSGR
jgi:hypothetical protein